MPPFPPPDSLDGLLLCVTHLHRARVHERLEALGLYRGQPPVVHALLEQDGQTHTALAKRLQVTAATMTRMVQRMERAGFVQRRPDPNDQRVSRVYLTDAGRAVDEDLHGIQRAIEALISQGLSPDERETLRGLLLRVRDNLEHKQDAQPA